MTPREIIAKEPRDIMGDVLSRRMGFDCQDDVTAILEAFTSAGYRILGPGEWDKETVEKCAEVVEEKADSYADPKEVSLWDCAKPISVRLYGAATDLRALAKEKQG